MNENIDLTKILKDCPEGTKLYTTIWGEVTFIKVSENVCNLYPIIIYNECDHVGLTKDGRYLINKQDSECILFPSKDQRDWSKFSAPWYKKEKMNTIAQIEKQRDKDKLIQELGKYKVKYTQEVLEKYINSMNNKNNERLRKTTIAFLKDFAEQGYENAVECIDWLEKQREQEEHKFKVGDKLIQNKFDPKTLKPFDKVLARDCLHVKWTCGFFSHIVVFDDVCKYNVGEILYTMCIPYNDDTKYLVGKRAKHLNIIDIGSIKYNINQQKNTTMKAIKIIKK